MDGVLRKAPAGCSCIYVRLSKRAGVKLFCDRETRDSSMHWQKVGYHNKIAPPVGDSVYISREVVLDKIADDLEYSRNWWWVEGGWHNPNMYGYVTYHVTIDKWARATEDTILNLHSIMEHLGMEYYDTIGTNLGWYRKKLVCIDFDPESISCY